MTETLISTVCLSWRDWGAEGPFSGDFKCNHYGEIIIALRYFTP